MWVATVDTKTAFDSISHQSPWKELEKCGIEPKYISFLRRLYAEQKGTVLTDKESDMLKVRFGGKVGFRSSRTWTTFPAPFSAFNFRTRGTSPECVLICSSVLSFFGCRRFGKVRESQVVSGVRGLLSWLQVKRLDPERSSLRIVTHDRARWCFDVVHRLAADVYVPFLWWSRKRLVAPQGAASERHGSRSWTQDGCSHVGGFGRPNLPPHAGEKGEETSFLNERSHQRGSWLQRESRPRPESATTGFLDWASVARVAQVAHVAANVVALRGPS